MSEWNKTYVTALINETFEKAEKSSGHHYYEPPVIGFSSYDDPLYQFFKKDIGDFYWSPLEAFSKVYDEFEATKLRVISLVFSQTEETRTSNRSQLEVASYEWAHNRLEGQGFIERYLKSLADSLNKAGVKALVPSLLNEWENHKSLKYGFASSWSERHTAFVSGLGTFGLSEGLITENGKAHRCGSLIVELDLMPTERPYSDYHEYCLFFRDGSCKACVGRCPAGAINEMGHDKYLCRTYQKDVIRPHNIKTYALKSSGCGLCQVGVPCEFKNPSKT